MSQPAEYDVSTAFVSYQANASWFPGTQLDAEFNNLATVTDQIRANLALIQRDDGALANGSVTFNSLSPTLQTAGLYPLSTWVTGKAYVAPQAVINNSSLYQCAIGHTSGAFAADLAAGDWTLIANLSILSGTNTIGANLVAAGPTSGAAAFPTFRSLAGADLPNPSNTALGGVKSIAAVGSQWVNSISTAGQPTLTQPAFSDISGSIGATQGALTNTRLAKSANYTIANADKGSMVALGGSTLFTLTVNAATGYDANFAITIVNEDTGLNSTTARGKAIAINGYTAFILWPGQMFVLVNQNNWWQFNAPGRWNAIASVTLNVNHASGSDTNNDGLGSGAGAFATIYNAFQVGQSQINVGLGNSLIIQNVNETFTESPPGAFLGPALQGGSGGVVFIKGNEATPTSCVWQTAGIVVNDGATISLRGFKMVDTTTTHTGITVDKDGLLVFANMEFGTFTGGAHMQLSNGGNLIYEAGTYTVSGNANYHIFNNGGNVAIVNAAVSVPNALTFTAWYGAANSGASGVYSGTTFSGTGSAAGSTGKKYDLTVNASLRLNSATLPGASVGTTGTGGQVTA